jgi:hypothetical protein
MRKSLYAVELIKGKLLCSMREGATGIQHNASIFALSLGAQSRERRSEDKQRKEGHDEMKTPSYRFY